MIKIGLLIFYIAFMLGLTFSNFATGNIGLSTVFAMIFFIGVPSVLSYLIGLDHRITLERKTVVSTENDKDDLDVCPNCGGPADNGHDRCVPPTPYLCKKCSP